jgi:hypothetical protein
MPVKCFGRFYLVLGKGAGHDGYSWLVVGIACLSVNTFFKFVLPILQCFFAREKIGNKPVVVVKAQGNL